MVGVIGDPISHSLSPTIHNAAFRSMALDWVSVAFPVPAGSAPAALAGMRAMGIRGLSVTMPHKAAVAAHVDRLTAAARALDAVNCIFRDPDDDSVLVGDNTDGDGFLRGLLSDFELDPAGSRCVVLGAGGAARSVVRALAGAGAELVAVANRDQGRAQTAAALAGGIGRVLDASSVAGAIAEADLVVNATPVGMGDDGAVPCEVTLLRESQVVADLVYHPAETALVRAARESGARASNGVSMLVQQAAIAVHRWTGSEAPVLVMSAAAAAQLR